MFVGVGASRVRDLFETARRNAPCIVFVDEIDAVGRQRGTGVGGGHDEREQTLNQLLTEMDGFERTTTIIVIAATNRADILDAALLRPGRFDRHVTVDLPDVRGREAILAVHSQKVKVEDNVSLERIALGTPGFSGAELEKLVNEAALLTVRQGLKKIQQIHLEEAIDKSLMGPERKSMVLSKDVIKETAYHETGHAIVAYFLKSKWNVHKITVIPRGRALGVTSYLPQEERYSESLDELLIQIAALMGGRAAEEIQFQKFTTGASDDIRRATDMARKMVCKFGMSRLGPVNYGNKSENPFLGRGLMEDRGYSDHLAHEIDQEVTRLITTQYDLAKKVITDNLDIFNRVSLALIQLETITGEEFTQIVLGSSVEDLRKPKDNDTDTTNTDKKEEDGHESNHPSLVFTPPLPSS